MVTASERTPELPHALLAYTVILPLVLPHITVMEDPLVGPRMTDPAGRFQVYEVAPMDPAVE